MRLGRNATEGSLTAFTAVFIVAMMAVAGLVVDGGRYLAARQAASSEAEQAARAGASSLDVSMLRGGSVNVDPSGAVVAAQAYMAQTGHGGSASVNGTTVEASVNPYPIATVLLQLVGIDHLTVTASARATDVHGITREDG